MKHCQTLLILCVTLVFGLFGCTKGCSKESAVPTSRVFFVVPHDGDTVSPSFTVKFGVEGMTVRPAGENVTDKTSGHHHLFIDDALGYEPTGQVVPADATHIHYGKGQTETVLTLTPGKHTLSLQFADGAHLSYGKDMSQTITVTVGVPETK